MNREQVVEQLSRIVSGCDALARSIEMVPERNGERAKDSWGEFCSKRSVFLEQLAQLVTEYGGEPARATEAPGALRRALGGVRWMIQGHGVDSAQHECQRRERALLRVYEETCELNLPIGVAGVLMRQYGVIKRLHYDRGARSMVRVQATLSAI